MFLYDERLACTHTQCIANVNDTENWLKLIGRNVDEHCFYQNGEVEFMLEWCLHVPRKIIRLWLSNESWCQSFIIIVDFMPISCVLLFHFVLLSIRMKFTTGRKSVDNISFLMTCDNVPLNLTEHLILHLSVGYL